MKGLTFYIVDVFTSEKYAGNQLAVVTDAAALTVEQMQRLAQEMHFSETTFVRSGQQTNGGYDVRIFTPEHELPFAGHPTLGTAFVIQQELIGQQVGTVKLNVPAGQIPVSFSYGGDRPGRLSMKQLAPSFGRVVSAEIVASVLRLKRGDIDEQYPIQEVSTGTPALLVPLKSLAALKSARTDLDKLNSLLEVLEARTLLMFCRETYDAGYELAVRCFADCLGVPEDPATGSANGCLAGYLVKHRYFGTGDVDIAVQQGHEIGRRSVLYLKAAENADGEIDVRVGGEVMMVAKGELV